MGWRGPDSGKHSILRYRFSSSLNITVILHESKEELKTKIIKKGIFQFYRQWINPSEKTCLMINDML